MADAAHDLSQLRIERTAAGSTGRGRSIAVVLAVIVIGAAVVWFAVFSGGDGQPLVELAAVQRVGGAQGRSGTAANGYVVARKRAALSTEIQGRVVEMCVEEGDLVKQGELIARLDTSQLDTNLARTKAELRQAEAAAEFAKKDFDRLSKLDVPGDITPSRYDEALAARDEADARVDAITAAVAEIEVRIHNSSIFAPFAGIIVEKNAEVGEVVSAIGATGPNARGAVATLVDRGSLEVQVELAQTSLRAARQGAPVLIYLDAYPDDGYRGKVRQIWPTANRTKATVELRAEFIDRDDRILPEMGVRVIFVDEAETEPKPAMVFVPARAVVGGVDPYVFVFAADTVSRRDVTVEESGEVEGRLRVLSGLSGRELVVLDPPPGLLDGDTVRRRLSE
jgi:RND family efflux transporter MFP subunit